MSNQNDSRKLRIAISGGGLAGATLANALVNQPHLDVAVFESAPKFSERGAAVGLATNAQQALKAILPSADELLDRAGAVSMNSTRLMIVRPNLARIMRVVATSANDVKGSGSAAGTLVLDLAGQDPGRVVHRAALLSELLAPIPLEALHPGKKLIAVESEAAEQQGITLRFEDGSSTVVDALIGADGIFGLTRQHVLGPDSSDCKPVPGGWWDCRNLVPIEKAKATLGDQFFETPRQYGWLGDGGFIMHDILDNGTVVQCVASCVEKNASADRRRPLTRDLLETSFANWMEGPITKGIIHLLLDQEGASAYSQWEHTGSSTFAKGRVCVVGDAAHAMTPWQGSGAAQAIEDAVILGTLFASIENPKQIENALKAYDLVRRPRAQQIVDSSRLTGQIMTGQVVGVDADKMRDALSSRWKFIYDFSIEKHKEDALTIFDKLEKK